MIFRKENSAEKTGKSAGKNRKTAKNDGETAGKSKSFSRRFVDNNGSFLYNVKVRK